MFDRKQLISRVKARNGVIEIVEQISKAELGSNEPDYVTCAKRSVDMYLAFFHPADPYWVPNSLLKVSAARIRGR